MNGFLSFLSTDNENPPQSEEDFDVMNSDIDDIIRVWLRQYIHMYPSGFTLDEAMVSITSSTITDEVITFTLLNPYTKISEDFEFGINILQGIEKDTRSLVRRICYDGEYIDKKIYSISPELVAIVQSWCPEITREKIIYIDVIPSDDGDMRSDYKASDDHIELYYYAENNEVKYKWLPNIFNGEYKGTEEGVMDLIGKERRNIINLLTKKTIDL